MMRHFSRSFIAFIAIAGLLISMIPPVRGDTTITLTTTSDFDGGVKSDPGALWLAENCIDQCSNWIAYPRSWYANGRTYTVWQGDTNYKIRITYYDHASRTWATPVVVIATNAIQPDGHGSPALGITNDGYLHVFCCSHGTQIMYYRSAGPYDISSWTNQSSALNIALGSYPHVEVLPSGTMYLFYRDGAACGASGFFDYKTSTDSGGSWSSARVIMNFGVSACAYVGNTEQSSNRIYMSWTRSSAGVERNIYSGYLDLATDHMFCGVTDLGITIDDTENTASCLAVTADANKETGTCCVAMHIDSSNNVYLIYSRQNGSSSSYDKNFTRWTGASWTAQQFIVKTDFFLDTADFRIFSATDIRAYLTTPGIGSSPNGGWTGDIDEYRWNGATWSFNQRIINLAEGGRKLNANSEGLTHPQVVRNYQNDLWLIFNSIVFYASPADGHLYAYGDAGFVLNPAISSGVYGVETVTDDPVIAAGSVELSSGKGDTFGFADADATTWRWFWAQSGTAYSTKTDAVSGGVLQLGITGIASLNRLGAISRFRISGDFDVQVKILKQDDGASFNTGNLFMLLNEQIPDYDKNNGGTATVDGIVYERQADTTLKAETVTDGVKTQIGASAFPAFPACERFTRTTSSNTITWYYTTTADCTGWTQHQTTTFATSSTLYVIFASWYNGGGFTARYDFENYQIAVGAVAGGGTSASADTFRRSGSWTSPILLTTDAPLIANKIVVGVANLSAINTASVELFDDRGTDRKYGPYTTGSTITILSGVVFQGNISVRVFLTGNGASTPSLLDISVTFGDFIPAQATLMPIIMLFAIWAFLLSLGMGTKSGIFVLFSGLAAVGIGLYTNSAYTGLPATFITVLMGGIGLISIFVGLLAMEMVRE